MFLYIDENDDNIFIDKYIVEHDLENATYALWLFTTEHGQKNNVDYFEFINYDEVYKYIGQLRFNYLERFTR